MSSTARRPPSDLRAPDGKRRRRAPVLHSDVDVTDHVRPRACRRATLPPSAEAVEVLDRRIDLVVDPPLELPVPVRCGGGAQCPMASDAAASQAISADIPAPVRHPAPSPARVRRSSSGAEALPGSQAQSASDQRRGQGRHTVHLLQGQSFDLPAAHLVNQCTRPAPAGHRPRGRASAALVRRAPDTGSARHRSAPGRHRRARRGSLAVTFGSQGGSVGLRGSTAERTTGGSQSDPGHLPAAAPPSGSANCAHQALDEVATPATRASPAT